MKIVVNHLTRMLSGYICVAGVDVATRQHVRPMSKTNLRPNLLAEHGGPFAMAAVVDLGPVKSKAVRPEVEDRLFDPAQARVVKTLERGRFWNMLTQVAERELTTIFGEDLHPVGASSCAVDKDTGQASLGCLLPKAPPELYVRKRPGRRPQVRMRLTDGTFDVDVGVADLRLYGADHKTPDVGLVEVVAEQLRSGRATVLSVGLTRPYAPTPEQQPVHWLQVNNIHFEPR